MRHWLVRILLALIVLAALVVAVIQGVLWSDLPRRLVVNQLQRQTGLNVRLDALEVGWSGSTVLRDLRLALPLSGQPILEAGRIDVEHQILPLLLVGRPLKIESLATAQPTVHLRRDVSGQWNVQHAIEAVLGARPPADPTRVGPIELPALDLRDITFRIEQAQQPPVELADVDVIGRTGPGLGYQVRVDAAAAGTLDGRIGRASPHPHELRFNLHPPEPLVAALGIDPRAYRAQGQWRGQIQDDGSTTGKLTLTHVEVPDVAHFTGRVTFHRRGDNGALSLQSRNMHFQVVHGPVDSLTLDAGRLTWQDDTLTIDELHLLALDGEAHLSGAFNPFARTGELQATWRNLTLPSALEHTGNLELTLRKAGASRRRADATVHARIGSPLGEWRGQTQLTATGRHWRSFNATLTTRRVNLTRGGQTFTLPEITGDFTIAAPRIRLERLSLLDTTSERRLQAQGAVNWQTRAWSIVFEGERLPVPVLPAQVPELGSVRINASGREADVELHHARISGGNIAVTAEGRYESDLATPLLLDVQLEEAPLRVGHYVGDVEQAWIDAQNLAGGLRISGTLRPLELRADGELVAEALQVYREHVGDLTLVVHADADDEAVRARADAVEWLGGQWLVRFAQSYGDEPRLIVEGEQIDLSLVDRLLGRRIELDGRADLRIVTAPPTQRDIGRPLTGSFELRDLARGPVRADRVTGELQLAAGKLSVDEIEAQYNGGRLTGDLAIDLSQPTQLIFNQTIEQWPLLSTRAAYQVRIDGTADGTFDVAQRSGQAEAQLRAVATFEPDQPQGEALRELAVIDSGWRLEDARLTLHALEGTLVGGTMTGNGQVNLNVPSRATLDMSWQGVAPSELAPVAEPFTEAAGTLAGGIKLAPADERHAIGPLRIDLRLDQTNATYRGLPIGAGHATAYLDPEEARYVLQEMRVEAVGGAADLWGRVSWHAESSTPPDTAAGADERTGGWYAFAQGQLEGIDLEMLMRTLQPDEEPIVGRIDATATVTTPLHDWGRAFGRGSMALRESDIGSVPLISELYDLVNVNWFGREPEGQGEASFRVENGAVVFDRFHYTNRGTQIELAGKIVDIWRGTASPIEGYALVSVTPLPDIELLEVINQAVVEIQAGTTAALIRGTLREPRAEAMLFHALQDELGRLLIGAQYEDPETDQSEQTSD